MLARFENHLARTAAGNQEDMIDNVKSDVILKKRLTTMSSDKANECSICLEQVLNGTSAGVLNPCGHSYHEGMCSAFVVRTGFLIMSFCFAVSV